MSDVEIKINPKRDHPELFLSAEIAIEVLGSDGPIGRALKGYTRNLRQSTWRCALRQAQHVIRYAGLPDIQTKALIDEIESYMFQSAPTVTGDEQGLAQSLLQEEPK